MTNTAPITSFRGEYYFLSNYATTPFRWQGIDFLSGEQAFAWAKTKFCPNPVEREGYERDILAAQTPGEAKRLGRAIRIRVDEWDAQRVQQMRMLVHAKFMTGHDSNGHGIVGPLCNTGAAMLVEGNDWGDTFWGRCFENGQWVGLNVLGVILMEERGWWSRGDDGRPT